MDTFTCITEVRDSFHVSQHVAMNPKAALRSHIGAMSFDDGDGPFDDELAWLQRVSGEDEEIELIPVGHCKNTWLWSNGARFQAQYATYVVKTEMREG